LAMGSLHRVACGHEKALRAEGLERPIRLLSPARHPSAPSGRRGWRIREQERRAVSNID
jgi:hypothetical protein